MCTPCLRQLKKDFPNIHLTFGVEICEERIAEQLLKFNDFLDGIINARYFISTDYDFVIDITSVAIQFEQAGKISLNRIDIFANSCGIPLLENPLPFYQVSERELAWAQSFLKGKQSVVLHISASEEKRSWPVEKYRKLIHSFKDYTFLIIDTECVLEMYSNCINITSLSLREKAALIKASDLFLGPDSGPMHIAGAVNTKSIVLFGATPSRSRINHYSNHYAVSSNQSCSPCWYNNCPFEIKCMNAIDSNIVCELILHLMEPKL